MNNGLGQAEEWEYRGEGAANIVLSYHGIHPELAGRVLRVHKRNHIDPSEEKMDGPVPASDHSEPSQALLSGGEEFIWSDWPALTRADNKVQLIHLFSDLVMRPLLGRDNVDPGIILQVPDEFLMKMEKHVADKRPPWRVKAGAIDLSHDCALLMSDHCRFEEAVTDEAPRCRVSAGHEIPSICVEIKPKCGFLPDSPAVSEEHKVKKSVPRFAMHQHLKLRKGQSSDVSQYIPLDLFSLDRSRMANAFRALVQCPQNNLRVFRDGTLVFGGKMRHGAHTKRAIPGAGDGARMGEKTGENGNEEEREAEKEGREGRVEGGEGGEGKGSKDGGGESMGRPRFEKSQSSINAFEDMLTSVLGLPEDQCVDAFFNLVVDCLLDSGILGSLLAAQKLDGSDVEGAIHAYNRVQEHLGHPLYVFKERPDAEFSLETKQQAHPDSARSSEAVRRIREELTVEECRQIVRDFLIAATAKDCGIMLALTERRDVSEGERVSLERVPGAADSSNVECGQGEGGQHFRLVPLPSAGKVFEYKIAFIDLDLKSFTKIPFYYELDKEIVEHYSEVISKEQRGQQ